MQVHIQSHDFALTHGSNDIRRMSMNLSDINGPPSLPKFSLVAISVKKEERITALKQQNV